MIRRRLDSGVITARNVRFGNSSIPILLQPWLARVVPITVSRYCEFAARKLPFTKHRDPLRSPRFPEVKCAHLLYENRLIRLRPCPQIRIANREQQELFFCTSYHLSGGREVQAIPEIGSRRTPLHFAYHCFMRNNGLLVERS